MTAVQSWLVGFDKTDVKEVGGGAGGISCAAGLCVPRFLYRNISFLSSSATAATGCYFSNSGLGAVFEDFLVGLDVMTSSD